MKLWKDNLLDWKLGKNLKLLKILDRDIEEKGKSREEREQMWKKYSASEI